MREIKFKVWRNYLKNMSLPFDLETFADDQCECGAGDFTVNENEGDALLQFTGLHDKNGAAVYEGDILEFLDGSIAHIFYCLGGACFTTDRNGITMYDSQLDRTAKIVGNIYETPELLEDKK